MKERKEKKQDLHQTKTWTIHAIRMLKENGEDENIQREQTG